MIDKNFNFYYSQLPPSLSYDFVYIENDDNISEIKTGNDEKDNFNRRMLCLKNVPFYHKALVEVYALKLAEIEVMSSNKIKHNWIIEFKEDLGIF